MAIILIAIGANLPGLGGQRPIDTCRAATLALDGLLGLRLRALSRWYRSAPVPASDQPDFVNGIAHLEGEADPAALLAALQELEAKAGRRRSVPNSARVLDLDIVAMGDLVRSSPDPVLPHPRAHERRFVLLPLRDVSPAWWHPKLRQNVDALIAQLPPQSIDVL